MENAIITNYMIDTNKDVADTNCKEDVDDTKKDVDDTKKDVDDTKKDVDDIKKDVDDTKKDAADTKVADIAEVFNDEEINFSKDVFLSTEGLKKMAWEVKTYLVHNYQNENFEVTDSLSRYTHDYHPDKYDNRAADWLFVLNVMNFALWYPKGTKQWTIEQFTGYYALCAALKRAIDENIEIWNPKYYAKKLLEQDLKIIFKSSNGTEIPFLRERLTILRKVGKILLTKYQGTFIQCIKSCNGDPIKLYYKLLEEFDPYRDVVIYNDDKLYFCSKVETLLRDIWICFQGHELGFDQFPAYFTKTAMFVDHCSLQVLFHFKVLSFSEELMTKIENNERLEYGSTEEVEIRLGSVRAMEILARLLTQQCVTQSMKDFNYFILIDNFLWDYRHMHDQLLMETQPLPNVKCVFY